MLVCAYKRTRDGLDFPIEAGRRLEFCAYRALTAVATLRIGRYYADSIGGKGGTRTLAPHRPERARFTHSVLHSTGWPTIRHSDGRLAAQATDRSQPTVGTAPK